MTYSETPVSLAAIQEADLGKLLVMILTRLNVLEKEVAGMWHKLEGPPTDEVKP